MPDLRNSTKLNVQNEIRDVKLFAINEATKARRWAVTSFTAVVGAFSVLLAIIGYFGINEIAKRTVDKFIEEKGIANSLKDLGIARDSARQVLKMILAEYQRAKSNSDFIANLGSSLPQVVGFLETSIGADYGEVESEWRYVPYQDNKAMEIPISVGSKVDLFLVAFNYRSIGSQDGFKSSRISVRLNGNSIKTVSAVGGAFRANQFDASGSVVLTNLNKGQYSIRLEDFDSQKAHKKYEPGRQLIVYKVR